jgi:hypothetical protein
MTFTSVVLPSHTCVYRSEFPRLCPTYSSGFYEPELQIYDTHIYHKLCALMDWVYRDGPMTYEMRMLDSYRDPQDLRSKILRTPHVTYIMCSRIHSVKAIRFSQGPLEGFSDFALRVLAGFSFPKDDSPVIIGQGTLW